MAELELAYRLIPELQICPQLAAGTLANLSPAHGLIKQLSQRLIDQGRALLPPH